jgi:uncharacterized membrane protein YhaH (DUF805 family)
MISLADSASTGTSFYAFGLIALGYVLYCFPLALVFKKAGETPWTAFIPILNIFVLCKTAGRPGWWVILYFIPIVGFIVSIVVYYDVAQAFEHGAGFTIGLVLLPWVFLFILAMGKDRYRRPAR